MTARTARRALAVLAAVVLVGVGLTGCEPGVPSPPPTVAPTASAAAVAQCPSGSGAAVSPTVDYSSLPTNAGFTDAVADAGGRVVRVGAGTVAFDDFTPGGSTIDGGVLGTAASGLIGAGVGRTVLEVAPNSSTQANRIPTRFPETNQLSVLRVTGPKTVLRGFTVQGTPQGHVYNGLRVERQRNLRASDISVVGIPGDDKSPPGETFGINDYGSVGSRWSHIDVDGAGVGASGFAVNNGRDITVCDTTSHDNAAAMGFAIWQTKGFTCVDCSAIHNGFSGFNFERVSGTTTLVRPVATGNRYDMRIASDKGSGRYVIIDPQLVHGVWTVTLPNNFYGVPNRQLRSDITLIIHGKPRPDLLRFQTY